MFQTRTSADNSVKGTWGKEYITFQPACMPVVRDNLFEIPQTMSAEGAQNLWETTVRLVRFTANGQPQLGTSMPACVVKLVVGVNQKRQCFFLDVY